jgi:hypothetical protein
MGATGGASLGLALDGWKRAVLLALVEATALFVGIYLSVFIGMALGLTLTKVFLEIFRLVYPFIMGAVIGAIGGVVIGLALKDWKRTGFLALAGAIGFGAVAQFNDAVFLGVFNSRILSVTVPLVVWGLVGGASLGTALGCLERRKGGEVNQTDRQ